MDSRTLDAIAAGLNKAAASSIIPLDRQDVPAVQAAITNEVRKTDVHLKNQEPWYQSRVTLGALASIILAAAGAFGVSEDIIDPETLTGLLVAAGIVVSNLFTLYGRWKARKPLGS